MVNVSVITLAILSALGGEVVRPEPVNKICPVIPGDKADPDISTLCQGHAVAFCCDRGMARFEDDPEQYADRLRDAVAGGNVPARAGLAEGSLSLDPDISKLFQGDALMRFSARVHPAVVYLAIAGVPLAWFGFATWAISGREAYAKADAVPLFAATVATILAVVTGTLAHHFRRCDLSMQYLVELHQAAVAVLAILLLVLSAVRQRRWDRLTGIWRWAYAAGLIMALALVGATGYMEGSLLLGPEKLSW